MGIMWKSGRTFQMIGAQSVFKEPGWWEQSESGKCRGGWGQRSSVRVGVGSHRQRENFGSHVTGSPGRFSAEDVIWLCLEAFFLLLYRGGGLEAGRWGKMMVGTGVAPQVERSGQILEYFIKSDGDKSDYWMRCKE